jgi:arylamine N-acetyltransferase
MASTYTKLQLEKYFSHIDLPPEYRLEAQPALNFDFLTALHIHQISAVPYENLSLHYSASHTISLDPQALYRKIVTNGRGRGGYCMELASFFNHILRSLGFAAITAGVRIRPRSGGVPEGSYIGW